MQSSQSLIRGGRERAGQRGNQELLTFDRVSGSTSHMALLAMLQRERRYFAQESRDRLCARTLWMLRGRVAGDERKAVAVRVYERGLRLAVLL